MSSATGVAIAQSDRRIREQLERQFYLLAGCAFLLFVALGFQKFFLHGQSFARGQITPQIAPLVYVHGIGMSLWILFFITQSSLIVRGNRKLHMSLGISGAVLAALLIVVGLLTAIGSVHYNPNDYAVQGGARRFLIIPITEMVNFGVFVAIGFRNRHNPEIHRPLMLLATLSVMGAALFRIPVFRVPAIKMLQGSHFAVFGPWIPMLTLGLLLGIIKWLMTGSWDRYYARG
jgi:hypothetical protein